MARPSKAWFEYIEQNIRADFETGELFWKVLMRGKDLRKPIGCRDSNGYIKVTVAYKSTYAHRIIFWLYYKEWPRLIDHIDQDKSNNRPENLRASNNSENALNSKLWSNNKTGVKNVSLTRGGLYKVTKGGKHLGYFASLKEAAIAANN